jgi:hypothetical protein
MRHIIAKKYPATWNRYINKCTTSELNPAICWNYITLWAGQMRSAVQSARYAIPALHRSSQIASQHSAGATPVYSAECLTLFLTKQWLLDHKTGYRRCDKMWDTHVDVAKLRSRSRETMDLSVKGIPAFDFGLEIPALPEHVDATFNGIILNSRTQSCWHHVKILTFENELKLFLANNKTIFFALFKPHNRYGYINMDSGCEEQLEII